MKLDRPVAARHLQLVSLGLLLTLGLVGCDSSSTGPDGGMVAIFDLSADILRPGETFTIYGQNFASTGSANDVRLHGVPLTVLDAGSGQLTVRIPASACIPHGAAAVRVRVGEKVSDPVLRDFEGAPGIELARGEFARITAQDGHCFLLDAAGSTAEYLVGIQRVSEASGLLGVVVDGRVPGPGLATGAGTLASRTGDGSRNAGFSALTRSGGHGWFDDSYSFTDARTAPPVAPSDEEATSRWARHRAAEADLRMRERALLEEMALRTFDSAGTDPSAAGAPRVPANVQPGDSVSLMVPDLSSDNFCTNGLPIEGVVRRVGARSVWVSDVANPDGGFSASDYDLLSDAFDQMIHDEVVSFFGEPTDLDSNGRIVIVISEAVNRVSEALGFVVSTDFTNPNCAGSNYGEYYYARAPDPEGKIPNPDGEVGNVYTASQARADAPRLLAHELTHILQFGRSHTMSSASNWQPVWLLEGQATLAEEITGHLYAGNGPRQNLGGAVAFNQNYPPGGVAWYLNPFLDLGVYYGFGGVQGGQRIRVAGAPQECRWIDVVDPDPCISARIAYGVSWSLLRWLSDHFGDRFGGGERELQQLLVTAPVRGFEAIEHVVGEDMAELLPRWAASLWVDGRVPGLDPLLTFPSWNLRTPQGVDAGLHPEAHLTPVQRSFSDFRGTIQVTGGSSHYQLIGGTGGHPAFALSATGTGGSSLPGNLQLWVVRTR
jgi:hypothetical protein